MELGETPEPRENPYCSDPDTAFEEVSALSEEEAHEQVRNLRAAIHYHDRQYYVENDPEIADRTYDALFSRLSMLEDRFGLKNERSPTARVGGDVLDELDTVEHVAPMLSIESVDTPEGVRDFERRIEREIGKERSTTGENLQTTTGPESRAGGDDGNSSSSARRSPENPETDAESNADLSTFADSGSSDPPTSVDSKPDTGDGGATIEYVCEPKFDGLSVEVIYENGVYQRAATRGDGYEGDDVTENVRTIPSVPQRLRGGHPEYLVVRGEIHIPRDAFHEHNKERIERGDEPFANPRNAAAGTLRQLDTSVVAERPLSCFFFDVLDSSRDFKTRTAMYDHLQDWGLRVPDRIERVEDIEDAINYREKLLDDRDDLNFEVDGVVLKVNDIAASEALGATSHSPRWALAYKLPARSGTTTVKDITVQIGRTGRVTPVALLDPVDVAGVTVSRASLHNPDQLEELGVSPGDEITIKRAGDVIPYVEKVVEHGGGEEFVFPETCPECGSAVKHEGPLAYCTGGVSCPSQLSGALAHYVSRSGLDIEGLGEEKIEQLTAVGMVESIPDLYNLRVADLVELEGWGEKSARNLHEELEAAKTPPLADFLVALGVPEVGPTTASNLAREFGSLDSLLDATEEDLRAIEDIGPRVASEIQEFFDSDENRSTIGKLRKTGVDPQGPDIDDMGSELDGLTFVFTGSLSGMTRQEAEEAVEKRGANATSTVSGNTDYLVAGENPGESKLLDADSEDLTILFESDFVDDFLDS